MAHFRAPGVTGASRAHCNPDFPEIAGDLVMKDKTDIQIATEDLDSTVCDQCGAVLDISEIASFAAFDCPGCGASLVAPAQFGSFRLLRVLGAGGMGSVFLAEDEALGRQVALKVMLKSLGANQRFVADFQREAQAAAKLNHPNIAQIYSFGQHEGQPYIVMEFVPGQSLERLFEKEGKLSPAFLLAVGADIAEGLRVASEAGLVHGDIKPDNILLNDKKQAKLVDFGIAGMADEKQDEIWGTPYYIAPEKVKRRRIDLRTDIYSLGATLYHGIAGHPPFDGETPVDVVKARFNAPPQPLNQVRPDVGDNVAGIIDRMLQVEPSMRYPTYESLLADMRKYLSSAGGSPATSRRLIIRKKSSTNSSAAFSTGRQLAVGKGVVPTSSLEVDGGGGGLTGGAKAGPVAPWMEDKPATGKGIILALVFFLLLVLAGAGFVLWHFLPGPAADPAPQEEKTVSVAAIVESFVSRVSPRLHKLEQEVGDVWLNASNRTAQVWGDHAWPDIVQSFDGSEDAPGEPDREDEEEVAAEPRVKEGIAADIAAEASRVWSALEDLWEEGRAAEKSLGSVVTALDEIKQAGDDLDVDNLQLADLAPPGSPAGRVYSGFRATEEKLEAFQSSEAVLRRRIEDHKRHLARQEARRAREEEEARKRAEREREEAAVRAREEAEKQKVEAEGRDIYRNVQSRNYRQARWTLRDLRDNMQTEVGLAEVERVARRVDRLESLHLFLARQIKERGFPGGWRSAHRSYDVTAEDTRAIIVEGRRILWSEVELGPTVGMINYFLTDERQARKIRLSERVDQLINAALYCLVYGEGSPYAEALARELAGRSVQLFPRAMDTISDLMPGLTIEE